MLVDDQIPFVGAVPAAVYLQEDLYRQAKANKGTYGQKIEANGEYCDDKDRTPSPLPPRICSTLVVRAYVGKQ